MSIDIERFEEEDPDLWDGATNAERVLAFLSEHDDRAWKQSEIADRTGIKRGSIGSVLARLHERGLVRHRGEYWAITDDRERLRSAVDLHRITTMLNERYGSEKQSEWKTHAAEEVE
jgi:Mn-dependent DtxR family transcriptional regulator